MTEGSADNRGLPPEMQQNGAANPPAGGSQRSLFTYTAIALGLALFIRFFVAAPFIVSGASMLPTFQDLNYLIVDRLTYDFQDPKRGDVVVFKLPQNTSRDLIKRVIGLPGETIIVNGNSVTVINDEHPEGFVLDEQYLDEANLGGPTSVRATLDADEYFVLGDNRRVSADSRIWGELPKDDIVGRVFLRLFPLSQIGIFPGEARY